MKKVLAAVAAVLALGVTATPADAVNLYWTYGQFQNVEACKSSALHTTQTYGATSIQAGANHVQGALEPDIFITFFCLPNGSGATGLLTVAADHPVPTDEVQGVRDELWSIFTSSR